MQVGVSPVGIRPLDGGIVIVAVVSVEGGASVIAVDAGG